MDGNVEALRNLYVALGGNIEDVQDCSTIVEVLNVISGKYEGKTNAIINPNAINNIAEVAENIGGGGNPNTVQTITGTVADPFGDIDFAELHEALENKNASAILTIDASALSQSDVLTNLIVFSSSLIDANGAILGKDSEEDSSTAFAIQWSENGLQLFYMEVNGTVTDMVSYAENLPTSLTIVWHPLPEESDD